MSAPMRVCKKGIHQLRDAAGGEIPNAVVHRIDGSLCRLCRNDRRRDRYAVLAAAFKAARDQAKPTQSTKEESNEKSN
jgi:hypothetical protein